MTDRSILTEAEIEALVRLTRGDMRPISLEDIPERTGRDAVGGIIPGRRVWMGLIRRNLVLVPEEGEILLDDGLPFTFTAYLEITEEGRAQLRASQHDHAVMHNSGHR